MNLITLNSLVGEIRPYIPQAPIPTIERCIRNAARDFCRVSLCARQTLTPINIVADTASYDLSDQLDGNLTMVELLEARYHAGESNTPVRLEFTAPSELNMILPDWDTEAGTPVYAFHSDTDEITLAPIPQTSQTAGLRVEIAVGPALGATSIPAVLGGEWLKGIRAGALYYLYDMSGQEWYDPRKSAVNYSLMMEQAAEAKEKSNRHNRRRDRVMQYGGI